MTREQFIDIVHREQKGLRRFLLSLCHGNQMDADDIAQETLVKAYLARDKYNERNRASLWLMKIAYNTFINHHKKYTRHRTENIAEATIIRDEQRSDDAFRYQELEMAMDALSDAERTTLVLYYFEGYKIDEISQITDSSEAAIKKRLQRGREELKKRIQQ